MPLPAPLRLLIALLVVVQVGLPTAAALTDPAPHAATHQAHLSTDQEPGCQPVHHDLHCLLCRVLSTQPVARQQPASVPEALAGRVALDLPTALPLPQPPPASARQARAPPATRTTA